MERDVSRAGVVSGGLKQEVGNPVHGVQGEMGSTVPIWAWITNRNTGKRRSPSSHLAVGMARVQNPL